jgi:hypothetical protein
LNDTNAFDLILSGDATLFAIVALSLEVTLLATFVAALAGLPFGAFVALTRFPGRGAIIVLLNGMMGLPPVVVGLLIYLFLSRSGPLGQFGLLYTPQAMIIAQAVLITPIIAALSRQVIEDLWEEYRVGPKSDPAGVKGERDILSAFRSIDGKGAPFISRGDKSGTHAAELALWKAADLNPAAAKAWWYREIGQGMGAALNMASATNA